jgi:proline iminopeptidase
LDVREKRRLRTVSPFDNTGREDVLSGGVRMIPIETPAGTFNV